MITLEYVYILPGLCSRAFAVLSARRPHQSRTLRQRAFWGAVRGELSVRLASAAISSNGVLVLALVAFGGFGVLRPRPARSDDRRRNDVPSARTPRQRAVHAGAYHPGHRACRHADLEDRRDSRRAAARPRAGDADFAGVRRDLRRCSLRRCSGCGRRCWRRCRKGGGLIDSGRLGRGAAAAAGGAGRDLRACRRGPRGRPAGHAITSRSISASTPSPPIASAWRCSRS